MNTYELRHLFYRYDGRLCQSELKLGYFNSLEDVHEAIKYYNTQPGFSENQDSYTIRVRSIEGLLEGDEFFEAIIYIHSGDFEIESIIEIGLYADLNEAKSSLNYHNAINNILDSNKELTIEHIINKIKVNQMDWGEGFTVS